MLTLQLCSCGSYAVGLAGSGIWLDFTCACVLRKASWKSCTFHTVHKRSSTFMTPSRFYCCNKSYGFRGVAGAGMMLTSEQL